MKKRILNLRNAATVIVLFAALVTKAAEYNVTLLQSDTRNQIYYKISNALASAVAGDIVTVTGTVITSGDTQVTVYLKDGVTVRWEANYSGSTYDQTPLITLYGPYGTGLNGTFEVEEGSSIACNSLYSNSSALNVGSNNVTLIINGGTVSANAGDAIVGGSTISVASIIINSGKVSATSNWAIFVSNPVTINGGIVCATTGIAIMASVVTINGGLVYAYRPNISGFSDEVIETSNLTLAGGMVIGWNKAAGNTNYDAHTTTDITVAPFSATAMWDFVGTTNGISYTNGADEGFIPISAVTVNNTLGIPIITQNALPTGVVGASYNTTIAATENPTAWTVVSGALPNGLVLNNNGTISGTPTVAGDFTFTVKASNTHGSSSATQLSISVQGFLAVTDITWNNIASAKTGEPVYLYGYVNPYNASFQNVVWSVQNAGATGATISFDGYSYIFNATDKGTAVIRATVTDGTAVGTDFTKDFTIQVTGILCEIVGGDQYNDLQTALYNVPYNNTNTVIRLLDNVTCDRLQLSNQNVTFDLNGFNLTVAGGEGGGLSLYESQVDYTGTGSFKATTGNSGYSAMNISGNSSCKITSVEINDAGKAGIFCNYGNAVVTGNVTINAEGAYGAQVYSTNLTINGNITANTADANYATYAILASFQSNITLNGNIAMNGVDNNTGIMVSNESNVTVNGGITAPEYISFNGVSFYDGNHKSPVSTLSGYDQYTDNDSYVWVKINAETPIVISTPQGTLMNGTVGASYSATVFASNNPTNWGVATAGTPTPTPIMNSPRRLKDSFLGALPPGLSIDPATGIISGTPTAAGTYSFSVTAANSFGTSAPVSFNITTENGILTGIEPAETQTLKIYPNPVRDELHIVGAKNLLPLQKVEICDMSGRVVLLSSFGGVGGGFNVSALPAGVYFLKLQTDKGMITKKFVKE